MALTRDFRFKGYRLVYDEYGAGDKPVVLLPGLLFSRAMHAALADELAARGHHVFVLDPLGHGDSDRPQDMWRYSMPIFGEQTVALLDHLEIERAVVGGTSLGANITLEVAAQAPERLRGMVVEMPVLDNALVGCALAFTPLLVGLTLGAPAARLLAFGARRVPRGTSYLGDLLLDWMSQDPGPSSAVLQGLFFGRIAPPRTERVDFNAPALVIGHPRDPIHPFSDADMLVRELPDARLIDANSILEMRLTPERLTAEISRFVEGCWSGPVPKGPGRKRRPPANRRPATHQGRTRG